MDVSVFITLSYLAAVLLLGGLVLASWLRARAVRRQLQQHQGA